MLVVTAALQVSEQIKDAGAFAGLASILGLAVLSLLYFGQARELRRLREWAGRAPERTAELQQQADAAAAAPRRVAAQPVAAAPAARVRPQQPATAAGAAARPGALAVGQPITATGAPAAATPGPAQPVAGGAPVPAAPGASLPSAGPGAAPTATPATQSPAGVPGTAPANGVQPAPQAAPGSQETQAIPAVTPAAPGSDGPGPTGAPSPALPGVPLAPGPPSRAGGPVTGETPLPLRSVSAVTPRPRAGAEVWPPAEQEREGGPSGRRLGIIGGVTAAVLLLAVLGALLLGGNDPAPTTGARTTTAPSTDNEFVPPPTGTTSPGAPAVDPGDYAVYVLNGTQQNGIAAEVAKTLETDGYRSAGTGNAAVNTAETTEVFYVEGKKRGAAAVAKKLRVNAANVKAADPAITVQGPNADVIVQIGADKATP